ncbi:two-component system sensor histidine kinase YesM [Paenibacillus endophyticus]|uniref:Two-component system sensor histidine kinase YesM n=1 Tax=Paenibacillus endophyticus TaxID=1294268 RepID=A0A7W5GAL5_9BACL|nr:sensor histidine kinase [Paenibacillus endophyticus]MBB3152438.1 two-component system sensor histidine kinase YesM [Paenibacillus endophyticus]
MITGRKTLAWPRSFRFKLMVTSIVCILLPAFITLAVYNMLTKDTVKEEAVSQAHQKLELVDGYVTNLFHYMLYIANNVQNDSEMNVILKAVAAGKVYEGVNAEYEEFTDRSKITNKIDNMTVLGDKARVTILLKNGTHFANYPLYEYNPNLIREEPWFDRLNQLRGLESFWIGTTPTVFYQDKTRSPHQISMARTLRGGGLTPYGYVIVTILEDQVSSIFKKLQADQETMLLDAEGKMMSHPDPQRIGEAFPYAERAGKQADPNIIRFEGESYIVSTHKLSLTGWELVSMTPYKKAVYKLNSIFSRVFMIQLASFFVFLLLFVYLIGTFTRPLVRLGRVAETVQRGNLEVRSNLRGQDEIGYLGESFDQMLDRVKAMISEITMTQARKRKAELAMLQAQINPHFLFNVLNSIRMKVMRSGDADSAAMISSLSKLLRMTISQEKNAIPLHDEIDTIVDYVKLMNMRQKEKASLVLELDRDTLMVAVPRFFLQPIIENALIHGLSQRAGYLFIGSEQAEGGIQIKVRDDGQGMSQHTLGLLRTKLMESVEKEEKQHAPVNKFTSMGLSNVYERMRITYGERFEMEVKSEEGHGTEIRLYIPRLEAGDDV